MNIVLGSISPGWQPPRIYPPDQDPVWQVSYPVASAATVANTPPGMMINAQGKYYTPTPGALEYARSHPGWIDPAAANDSAGSSASSVASNAAAAAGRAAEAAQAAAMDKASDRASAFAEGRAAALAEGDEGPASGGLSPVMLLAAAAAAYFALK